MKVERQEAPTRAKLMEARDNIAEQLNWLRTPSRRRDYNPALVAKLEGMLKELNACLAESGTSDAEALKVRQRRAETIQAVAPIGPDGPAREARGVQEGDLPVLARYLKPRNLAVMFGESLAWAWAVIAGGGGFGLILTEGPLPLTHGWYALFSGLAWCPATAWVLKRYKKIETSYLGRLAVAALIILAGRIALVVKVWPFG